MGATYPIPARIQTEALFGAFQLASADNHPLHCDVEYCQARGHKGLFAHGLQTLIQTAPGASALPHLLGDSLLALLEQSSRFLAPVYAGDTLHPLLTIAELSPGRTTGVVTLRSTVRNQEGVVCLEGEMKLLVRRRPVPGSG